MSEETKPPSSDKLNANAQVLTSAVQSTIMSILHERVGFILLIPGESDSLYTSNIERSQAIAIMKEKLDQMQGEKGSTIIT